MKSKIKPIKSSWRENKWKTMTFVLLGLVFLLLINSIYENYEERIDEEKRICNAIEATPAWVDSNGRIIDYGVIDINQSNQLFSDALVEYFIENKIRFVYNLGCSACKLQISIFGDNNWNKYKSSGLTLNCGEVKDR